MRYAEAPDVKQKVEEIVAELGMAHIPTERVYCYRSWGTKSRRLIARIHGLERMWQIALDQPPVYAIEVISEKYDRLPLEEQEKTVIHELLHIPHGFKGGFRPHKGYVTRGRVQQLYQALHEKRIGRR